LGTGTETGQRRGRARTWPSLAAVWTSFSTLSRTVLLCLRKAQSSRPQQHRRSGVGPWLAPAMAEGMRAARASLDNRWFAMVASSSRGDAELEVSSGATFWGSGGEEMVRDVGLDDEAVQDGQGGSDCVAGGCCKCFCR
jgi:hypothetical protein